MYGIAYSNRDVIADFDCLGILARSLIGELAADAYWRWGTEVAVSGRNDWAVYPNSIHEYNGDSATKSTLLQVELNVAFNSERF